MPIVEGNPSRLLGEGKLDESELYKRNDAEYLARLRALQEPLKPLSLRDIWHIVKLVARTVRQSQEREAPKTAATTSGASTLTNRP